MKRFATILMMFINLSVGLIVGYAYGFKAYNRPIKWWEFWLKHRYRHPRSIKTALND